jgi:hypothetical protein
VLNGLGAQEKSSSYLDTGVSLWVRRGRSTIPWHPKRELRFFAIRIAEYFQFRPEWYRRDKISALVLEYYFLLRSVLRTKPLLRRCLRRCRHCRIFFLTDPRNAGRKDLGCAFGCKEAHRKQQSTQRSVEYYRGDAGQIKKAIQNGKRKAAGASAKAEPDHAPWKAPLGEHVRLVASLIEGRRVSREEILEMLARVLRQHRMVRQRRIDQVVVCLNENPP